MVLAYPGRDAGYRAAFPGPPPVMPACQLPDRGSPGPAVFPDLLEQLHSRPRRSRTSAPPTSTQKSEPWVGPEFVTTRRPPPSGVTTRAGPESVKKTLPAAASSGDHTHARHGELGDAIAAQPQAPAPATLRCLASYLPQLLTADGNTIERNTAIETLIHEIRISDEGLIPVYQIPDPNTPIPGCDDTENGSAVRKVGHHVELWGFEPQASCMPYRDS